MAEKEVLFEDNMETQAQDFNNLQDWIGKSIDDLVIDAIDAGNAYTGLGISKAASTQITIAPGRLYWGGVVYIMEDPVTIEFQAVAGAMPVTQKRQIAIVAWGSTITTDVQPRNFVVDADTGQAQPESVAMTQIRVCNVGPIPGIEAPSPNFPAVPATNLLIGYVLLDPSGVLTIQQASATQLTNLTTLGNVVGGLLSWQAVVNGQISTLQTALAALAAQLANYVTLDMFSKLADLVNQIWQIISRMTPPTFATDTIDNFFDTSQSAVGTNVDGAYNANVAEGIRFPSSGGLTTTLQLLNNSEPIIQAWDNFILPKPSGMRIRMDCSFPAFDWLAERIQAHPYWTFSPHKLNWARERHRVGTPFLPGPGQLVLNYAGQADPIFTNLRFDGVRDVWTAVPWSTTVKYPDGGSNWNYPRYFNKRSLYYWEDAVDVFYWNRVFSPLNYAANHCGQSFLNAQDGWLGGITVYSMQPNYYQPLTLLVCRCDDQGVPDHQQCIASLELDAAGVQACYESPMKIGDIIPIVGHVGGPGDTYPGGINQYILPIDQALYYQSIGYTVLAVPVSSSGLQAAGGTNIFNVYPPLPQGIAYPVRLTFSPVFLEAGKRYSFHLVSVADHQFAVTADRACYGVHQGDFWHYDSSRDWFGVAGSPKTLRFLLHYLVWGQWGQQASPGGQLRYQVDLQPLDLGGGITSVDVLAEHIIPPATDLSYAVRIGSQWFPFAGDPDNPKPLTGSTSHLPFQIWFSGTTDLMPGVSLVNSQVKLQGPVSNQWYHISTNIPRGAATTGGNGIKIITSSANFNSTNHTLQCWIHTSSQQSYTSTNAPAGVLLSDGVTTQHTWTFAIAGITNYQVELKGQTNGTGDNFVLTQRAAYGA